MNNEALRDTKSTLISLLLSKNIASVWFFEKQSDTVFAMAKINNTSERITGEGFHTERTFLGRKSVPYPMLSCFESVPITQTVC